MYSGAAQDPRTGHHRAWGSCAKSPWGGRTVQDCRHRLEPHFYFLKKEMFSFWDKRSLIWSTDILVRERTQRIPRLFVGCFCKKTERILLRSHSKFWFLSITIENKHVTVCHSVHNITVLLFKLYNGRPCAVWLFVEFWIQLYIYLFIYLFYR